MSLRIAIDTGGTFTDVIALDEETGDQFAIKTPSTPSDPSLGLLNGIDEVLNAAGAARTDIGQILHGTTTATNAVLEHKFEGLGLLVTDGFRHLIEIARQSVPDGYGNSFFWVKPRRLVPLHLVREVTGRMRHDGSELVPLGEESVIAAADELVALGVDRLAVCLLHSYANPAHENRVGALVAERHPDIHISLSSVVLPEYREYERAMTTLIDVMVKPYCKTYLAHAERSIRERSGAVRFLIMQSNGGIVTSAKAAEKPVTMLVSGPAGGVLGATHMARLADYRNVLTLDVGGTSTDVSLVQNLTPQLTSHAVIENYPVKSPMLDIETVGTGGGSLAWIDDYGALKVGPQSAGADPGPICYCRGGAEPTVTDAGLVLGRLPEALIGGGLKLDAGAARAAYEELGRELEIAAEEAAAGVLEIASANQVHGNPARYHHARPRPRRLRDGRLRRGRRAVRGRGLRFPRDRHRRGAPQPGQPVRLRAPRLRREARLCEDLRAPAVVARRGRARSPVVRAGGGRPERDRGRGRRARGHRPVPQRRCPLCRRGP